MIIITSLVARRAKVKCNGLISRFSTGSCEQEESHSPLKKNLNDVENILANSTPLKDGALGGDSFATTPYPEGTVFSQFSQASHSLRPLRNPKDTSIILFPGQGTQFVGMGRHVLQYPVAQDMFAAANEILGYDLLKLCIEGPAEKLNRTEYSQPAVLVCSLAGVERLKEMDPKAINDCIATAGNSLGEIAALVFAGSLNFERAVKLVKVRAEAMQLCSDMTPSGMLTLLIGADSRVSDALKDAKEHCRRSGIEKPECVVANYLYPSAKVIAGHSEALKFIERNSAKYKIRRTSRLPVSGAFHTRLMEPAVDAVAAVLRKTHVNDPIISVHRNLDGKRYRDASHIITSLPKQICNPVKWEQTMHILYERPPDLEFPKTYECGPGRSLTTLLRKVNAKAAVDAYNVLV